jgi:glycosyltransferase involved in cell wall biosynthesis
MTPITNADQPARTSAKGLKPKRMFSLIIPVYYNDATLLDLKLELDGLQDDLAERNLALETIFVDDGSGDQSYPMLLRIHGERPNTKVIKLTRNFGAISATRAGVEHVTGDAFCILAADLQDQPDQVLKMVDQWLDGERFVISVRLSRGDSFVSSMLARFYYLLFRALVIPGYPRGGFDLMLVDKELFRHFESMGKYTGLEIFAYWLGYDPKVLSYHRRPRPHGRSRWTLRKKFNYFLDNFTGFSVAPLRIMSALGILAALASFAYGTFLVLSALIDGVDVPGFVTVAVLISFFSGLILATLGLIGEYIWRIYDTVSGKPINIVEKVHE